MSNLAAFLAALQEPSQSAPSGGGDGGGYFGGGYGTVPAGNPLAPVLGDYGQHVSINGGGADTRHSGGGGLLGFLASTLSYPLSAVTGTAYEASKGLNELAGQDLKGAPRASLADWWKHIADPSQHIYGGDLISGNKAKGIPAGVFSSDSPGASKGVFDVQPPGVVRAGLGLGLDMAADPLTYVGGVGIARHGAQAVAGEVSENVMRKAAEAAAAHFDEAVPAERLARGALLERAAEVPAVKEILTSGAEATKRAARLGVSGLTKDEAAQFLTRASGKQVGARGLSFGKNAIIPGTDSALGMKAGEAFANLKAKLGDTFFNREWSGALETNRDLKMAARSLNSTPQEAFNAVRSRLAQAGAKSELRALGKTWASEYKDIVGKLTPEEVTAAHEIAGGAAGEGASSAARTAAPRIRQFYDVMEKRLGDAGVAVGHQDEYLPRVISSTDKQIMRDAGLLAPANVGKWSGGANFFAQHARSLVADEHGNYSFMGETFAKPADGEAGLRAKITEIAKAKIAERDPEAAARFGGFFNPDYNASAGEYIRGAAGKVAQAHAADKLYEAGFGRMGADVGAHALEGEAPRAPLALGPAAEPTVDEAAQGLAGAPRGNSATGWDTAGHAPVISMQTTPAMFSNEGAGRVVNVPLNRIVAQQGHINQDVVNDIVKNGLNDAAGAGKVEAVDAGNGNFLLENGNHRVAVAAAKNEPTIPIHITGTVTDQGLIDHVAGKLAPDLTPPSAADFIAGHATIPNPQVANVSAAMQRLADHVDQFSRHAGAALSAPNGGAAGESLAEALKVAHEATGQSLTPGELDRMVSRHLSAGPGGVPVADTAQMRQTLQAAANGMKQHGMNLNEELQAAHASPISTSVIDRVAGDAKFVEPEAPVATTAASTARASVGQTERAAQLVAEKPEETAARVQGIQGELKHIQDSVDGGNVTMNADQQRTLSEYMNARMQQAAAASARMATSDPIEQQAAALAESAAELRAAQAGGQKLGQEAIEYGNLSERQYASISSLIKNQMATELRRGLATPKQSAEWIAFANRIADPVEMKGILKGWDHVVKTLRNYEMLYPGFYPKIFLGHYFNNLPAGVKISDYVNAARLMRGGAREALSPEDASLLSDIRMSLGGGEVTGTFDSQSSNSLENLMGAKGSSTTWNPISPRFKVFKGTRIAGEKVTNILRGALAHHVLTEGGTVDQAVQAINHFQFDYQDLTRQEQFVRRHIIPFYTFTRNNLPLQIEQLIKNPKYVSRFLEAKHEVESLSPADKSTPSYFKSAFNIRLPWKLNGGATYFNPQMPQAELAKFFSSPGETGNNLAGMVSPLLKTPIESHLGKTFQEGVPLPTTKFVPLPHGLAEIPWLGDALDKVGVTHKMGGQQFINYRDAYVLGQAVPVLARMRGLVPREQGYKDRQLTTFLSFLGIPTSANTKLMQEGQAKGKKAAQTLAKQRESGLKKAAKALGG